jgi:hypothetical protein
MTTSKQVETPEEKTESKVIGTRIVVAGALASIALWMFVLFLGSPIAPFTNPNPSFAYAFVVCAPAFLLSVLAIYKAKSPSKK